MIKIIINRSRIELSEEETTDTKKYQILIRVAERPNNNSAYVFYKTHNADGSSTLYETDDTDALNTTIENLINTGINIGAKTFMPRVRDLVIVNTLDWFADAVSDILDYNLLLASESEIDQAVTNIFDDVMNQPEETEENGESGETGENDENTESGESGEGTGENTGENESGESGEGNEGGENTEINSGETELGENGSGENSESGENTGSTENTESGNTENTENTNAENPNDMEDATEGDIDDMMGDLFSGM